MANDENRLDSLRAGGGVTAASPPQPLSPDLLCRRCDPHRFTFDKVEELADPPLLFGQERATSAIQFGMAMRRAGYNIFLYGPPGSGRHTLVQDLVRRQAETEPAPPDCCYINNFADPRKPLLLRLPAGRASGLRDAMKHLVLELRTALPAAFEREDYRVRRDMLDQQFKQRHQGEFEALQKRAEAKDIAIIRTPMGLALAPMRDGQVLDPEVFKKLSEADRARIKGDIETLQAELESIMRKIPETEREHRAALRALNRETTALAVGHLLAEVRRLYPDQPAVLAYLDEVERDIQENADDFLIAGRPEGEPGIRLQPGGMAEPPSFRRYQVNLLVDNGAQQGAPVVYEDHPTHQMLVGRVEHIARFGTLTTDFSLLTAGALHRANGGYLIVDAERVLTASFAWETLKRALRSHEVRIETLEQMLSLASTVSLDPEPTPLAVKVVMVGSPYLYYLLTELDPEFKDLFKVAADFDDRIERTPESDLVYARAIAALVRRRNLRSFDRTAVARAIEQASRATGDGAKLSASVRNLAELLEEADHHAALAGKAAVTGAEVQAAIDAQRHRADRLYHRLQEEIGRNTIRIETAGAEIGQINGLSVLTLGGFAFGNPVRITARVRLGRGEVIDIEREVALGGPLHTKGVMILTGFVGGRYGRKRPLALTASLVFEQSYGGVEGDSASAAELFALLSAIAEVPIRQSIAVTGSVDQHGVIQAIGGVNDKIEAFFDVCNGRGLTGDQGVLIPAANQPHLMLRRDVVEAAAAGLFRIYPIVTVDQGLEILTGMPAGIMDLAGDYPEGSFNHAVVSRLTAFAARASDLRQADLAHQIRHGHA
jgi:lon-related putative ATP-dependent protease